MNALSTIDMQEATRLTREGRLTEAMALLRGERSAVAGSPQEARAQADTFLDMQPPTMAGGAWTVFDGSRAKKRYTENKRPMPGGGLHPASRHAGLRQAGLQNQPQADGARFEEGTFVDRAGARSYKLYIPSRFDGGALPLVVMLHGCTQSPDDFAAGTGMNALAEEHVFLVAYPAQPQSANASKCWNWFNAADQERDQGEPALIAGITRQIMAEFPVEADRVYVAGLSAGGAAAATMGSTYPDLYAAIGVHSGLACGAAKDMPSAFSAMHQGGKGQATARHSGRAVPTIVFHGDRDSTVNAVNGDQVIAQSRAGVRTNVDVSAGRADGGIAYTRTVHRNGEGSPILEHWVLHGAGHAWSGGSPAGSYTDPRGPDASREMIRFFLQHRLAKRP